jgi:hypothetical protein
MLSGWYLKYLAYSDHKCGRGSIYVSFQFIISRDPTEFSVYSLPWPSYVRDRNMASSGGMGAKSVYIPACM